MSSSRLLVAIEVLQDLLRRFREIAEFPSKFLDFVEYDSSGRRLGVHVFGRFAIKFWDDFADRHVKIRDLHFADRSR
jgi:hypothetical protein